jgi:SpoVK/Ycf46/Vps4 family AAA+-type ATPase
MNALWEKMFVRETVSIIQRIRKKGDAMGLTDCQKEMIRAVAENDIRKAKRCALASIAEDATQKNKWFCTKYRNILTSEGSALISLPSDLQGILLCEDPALFFKENRYYATKEQTDLAEQILRMSVVSQKLMELQVPYKNATLLYGPPGTGKTLFAKYIAYKKGLPFCYLNFSKAVDSYMGATSRNIAKAFTYVSSNPCVFLLDEVDAISCNRSKGMSDVASKEIGRVTITLMQEFDRLPNDVIVLGATNRLDILDEAFISRFPVKKEMLPFSEQESKAMVKKFLADIGYVFSEEEIMGAIRKTQNQREVMNRVVQVLAEKIAGGYDGE